MRNSQVPRRYLSLYRLNAHGHCTNSTPWDTGIGSVRHERRKFVSQYTSDGRLIPVDSICKVAILLNILENKKDATEPLDPVKS